MGVPAFYRWITEKFSKIISDILEKRPNVIDGTIIPINLNEPNPNETEYDNLFVDMNGLIHPCSHPEDRDAPSTEAEMYVNVCKYVDRLVAAIRPRRLLYLAIDGVAPRAKMNQQRSRRFRASKDMKEKKIMTEEIIADMIELGFPAPAQGGDEWDSNVITPGTEFMSNLTIYLRFYILDRMNRDPYWKNITVILSDASEPGEGEHKIMNFIRNQRSQPGYDPNQYHVLHGLDADLIMLALATHEAHFTILREKVTFGRQKELPEVSEAQRMLDAQSMHNGIRISCLNPSDEWIYSKPLEALDISTLREYLDNDFSCLKSSTTIQYDLERLIDDFIFLCFFVGNDFLPHLPSLDIREGALDFLLECYKELLPSLGGYLTNPGGHVNLRQVDVILGKVGEIEDQIFLMRRKALDGDERRKQERFGGGNRNNQSQTLSSSSSSHAVKTYNSNTPVSSNHMMSSNNGSHYPHNPTHASSHHGPVHSHTTAEQQPTSFVLEQNKLAAAKLKQSLLGKRSIIEHGVVGEEKEKEEGTSHSHAAAAMEMDYEVSKAMTRASSEPTAAVTTVPTRSMTVAELEAAKVEVKKRLKDKEQAKIDSNKESVVDDVRLHEQGWKDRYYGEKHKKENIEKGGGLERMRYSYVQGLCWVLRYYFQGVPSWNWYYPFHYAPFASDLVNIDSYGVIEFELSQPFRPIEQLLAVFPATSVNALPLACRWLMTDPSSPIFDLYDDDIPIDPDGKHLPWLWILLLPFVDEHRITEAFKLCETYLSIEDRQRNRFGQPVIFLHKNHRLAIEALATIKYQPCLTDANDAYTATTVAASSNDDHHLTIMNNDDDSSGGSGNGNGFDFDAVSGNGMSGLTTASPALFFSPLHSPIISPVDKTNSFRDITENHVICFTYNLHLSGFHLSKLLEGVRPDRSRLTPFDLIRQRPPRLNKSFNISDLFSNNNNNYNNNNNNYKGNNNNYQGNNNNYQGNNNNQYQNQRIDNYSSYNTNNHNNNYQGNNSYNMNNYQSNNSYASINNYNNNNNNNNGYISNHTNYHNNNNNNNSNNNNHFNSKAVHNNNNYGQYNQQQQQQQLPSSSSTFGHPMYSQQTVQPQRQQYHHQQQQQQQQQYHHQQQQQQQQQQYSSYQGNQATITPHNPPTSYRIDADHTITSIKDKAFQQQIDRSSRMYANPLTSNNINNSNRSTSINTTSTHTNNSINNTNKTAAVAAVSGRGSTSRGSTGRSTVYLEDFPVPQQQQQAPQSKRKGHSFLDKGHAADNNQANNNYQANSRDSSNSKHASTVSSYSSNNNYINSNAADYGANQYSHTFAHPNNNNPQYLQQQQQQQQSGQQHQYHQYNPQLHSTHNLRPPSNNSSSLPSLSRSSASLPPAPSMDAIRDQLRLTLQHNQRR